MIKTAITFLLVSLLVMVACINRPDETVVLYSDPVSPTSAFAVDRLYDVLTHRGYHVEEETLNSFEAEGFGTVDDKSAGTHIRRIILFPEGEVNLKQVMANSNADTSTVLKKDGFSLQSTDGATGKMFWVMGYDEGGVMYGGLELAEQIELYGIDQTENSVQNPRFTVRGTKFNIPLDARTPSYSDMSDVAQENIAVMWDFEFWTEYIDHLAMHRYNLISLWNLHPFPSMVRVPEYPDIALDDVKRTTAELEEYYSTRVVDIAGPEITGNLETLIEMSMDEKIAFWQDVMQYARDRNIDFYVLSWNIYTYGTEGKYGITDDFRNETTIDYFHRSIKAMFDTYPLLAGIGVTTGENFGNANFDQKEDWVLRTYGRGLRDAATENPDRHFTFVHRLHETGVQSDAATYAAEADVAAVDIANRFNSLFDSDNIEFLYSFKYAQAHVYSSTEQSFHTDYIKDIEGMKTLWTLRNDDVYYFRWGAPDFVREFINNMYAGEESHGIYLGSDQYIWGREFLSTEPEQPRVLELDKHWYQWMLWGRLGYSTDISNQRFTDIIQARFPGVPASRLFRAWQHASMIYPVTTGFHWGVYDFHWYIEGSRGRPESAMNSTGFHDINRFITLPPHPESGFASIPSYVSHVLEGSELEGLSPVEVAEKLHQHADQALATISTIQPEGSVELRHTIEDIQTMSWLGKHYAHKIRGAAELSLYRQSGDASYQRESIEQLKNAARYWRLYSASALTRYTNPLWTNRVGHVDWRLTMEHVLNDITIAGGEPEIDSVPPISAGTTLEAELGVLSQGRVEDSLAGYTGTGYASFEEEAGDRWVEWTYRAPEAATYLLEVRYAVGNGIYPSVMTVNRESSIPFTFWTTGGETSWASDRVAVKLDRGANVIQLSIAGTPRIDRLQISPAGH